MRKVAMRNDYSRRLINPRRNGRRSSGKPAVPFSAHGEPAHCAGVAGRDRFVGIMHSVRYHAPATDEHILYCASAKREDVDIEPVLRSSGGKAGMCGVEHNEVRAMPHGESAKKSRRVGEQR